MRGSGPPWSNDEHSQPTRPPSNDTENHKTTLTKEEKDELLEELAQQSIRGDDGPEEHISRGPIKEVIQKGIQEAVYVWVNLLLNLLHGEWKNTNRKECDCEGPCHHEKKPFSWIALLDLLRLFMLGLVLGGSYFLFHSYLKFPDAITWTIDALLLSLYISVLVHHTIKYWAVVVEEFRMTRRQLRH